MKALHELKEMLCKEIEKVTVKDAITPAEIEALYKVVDIIKDIDTIEAMEEYGEDDGYSERGYSRRGYSRRDGSYGYSEEGSYRRGRDSRTGRYVSRDNGSYRGGYRGYSREDARDNMMSRLEEAMDSASSEHERQAIMRCMEKLED